jgi:hypothetical protein
MTIGPIEDHGNVNSLDYNSLLPKTMLHLQFDAIWVEEEDAGVNFVDRQSEACAFENDALIAGDDSIWKNQIF